MKLLMALLTVQLSTDGERDGGGSGLLFEGITNVLNVMD